MDIRIVVFDVLGTVLDERSSFRAAAEAEDTLKRDPAAFAEQWLEAVNATVSRIAHGTEPWKPWDQIIAEHLNELTSQGPHARADRLRSVGHHLAPWPDSAAALRRIHILRDTVALSNAGITALMDSSRAGALTWSALLSSEMIQAAKPDPRVYAFLLDTLNVDPAKILFVAAHPWDLREAASQGMHTAFVQRPGEGTPHPNDRFDWNGSDLIDLASALEHDPRTD